MQRAEANAAQRRRIPQPHLTSTIMPQPLHDQPHIERQPWELDPSYDRCEAFDNQQRSLGVVWYEPVARLLNARTSRRRWIGTLVELPIVLLSALFGRR